MEFLGGWPAQLPGPEVLSSDGRPSRRDHSACATRWGARSHCFRPRGSAQVPDPRQQRQHSPGADARDGDDGGRADGW